MRFQKSPLNAFTAGFISLFTSLIFLSRSVWADISNNALGEALGYFGEIYKVVSNTDTNILNGIAIILFAAGVYGIIHSLLSMRQIQNFPLFSNERIRKVLSLMVSFFTLALLIIYVQGDDVNVSFVEVVGAWILFALLVPLVLYLAFVVIKLPEHVSEWMNMETEEGKPSRILTAFIWVCGFFLLDVFFGHILKTLSQKAGGPFIMEKLYNILIELQDIFPLILFILIIVAAFGGPTLFGFGRAKHQKRKEELANNPEIVKAKNEIDGIKKDINQGKKILRNIRKTFGGRRK